jgi:group I intron endonuclease
MIPATEIDIEMIDAMLDRLHQQTPEEAAAEGRAKIDAVLARFRPGFGPIPPMKWDQAAVYAIYFPNTLIYVGVSQNPWKRWRSHCSASRHATMRRVPPVTRALAEYGCENVSFEVLEVCSTETAFERETFWISELKAFEHGYNKTYGGLGCTGFRPSLETCQKIAKSRLGRRPSPETSAKMAAAKFGVPRSPETRAKLVAHLAELRRRKCRHAAGRTRRMIVPCTRA